MFEELVKAFDLNDQKIGDLESYVFIGEKNKKKEDAPKILLELDEEGKGGVIPINYNFERQDEPLIKLPKNYTHPNLEILRGAIASRFENSDALTISFRGSLPTHCEGVKGDSVDGLLYGIFYCHCINKEFPPWLGMSMCIKSNEGDASESYKVGSVTSVVAKALVAQKAGMTVLICTEDNKKEVEEYNNTLKAFVKNMDQGERDFGMPETCLGEKLALYIRVEEVLEKINSGADLDKSRIEELLSYFLKKNLIFLHVVAPKNMKDFYKHLGEVIDCKVTPRLLKYSLGEEKSLATLSDVLSKKEKFLDAPRVISFAENLKEAGKEAGEDLKSVYFKNLNENFSFCELNKLYGKKEISVDDIFKYFSKKKITTASNVEVDDFKFLWKIICEKNEIKPNEKYNESIKEFVTQANEIQFFGNDFTCEDFKNLFETFINGEGLVATFRSSLNNSFSAGAGLCFENLINLNTFYPNVLWLMFSAQVQAPPSFEANTQQWSNHLYFCGRWNCVSSILQSLNESGGVFLKLPQGMGKSALLDAVYTRACRSYTLFKFTTVKGKENSLRSLLENLQSFYNKSRPDKDDSGIGRYVTENDSEVGSRINEIINRLIDSCYDKPFLLVIDGLDETAELLNHFKENRTNNLKFIIGLRPEAYEQLGTHWKENCSEIENLEYKKDDIATFWDCFSGTLLPNGYDRFNNLNNNDRNNLITTGKNLGPLFFFYLFQVAQTKNKEHFRDLIKQSYDSFEKLYEEAFNRLGKHNGLGAYYFILLGFIQESIMPDDFNELAKNMIKNKSLDHKPVTESSGSFFQQKNLSHANSARRLTPFLVHKNTENDSKDWPLELHEMPGLIDFLQNWIKDNKDDLEVRRDMKFLTLSKADYCQEIYTRMVNSPNRGGYIARHGLRLLTTIYQEFKSFHDWYENAKPDEKNVVFASGFTRCYIVLNEYYQDSFKPEELQHFNEPTKEYYNSTFIDLYYSNYWHEYSLKFVEFFLGKKIYDIISVNYDVPNIRCDADSIDYFQDALLYFLSQYKPDSEAFEEFLDLLIDKKASIHNHLDKDDAWFRKDIVIQLIFIQNKEAIKYLWQNQDTNPFILKALTHGTYDLEKNLMRAMLTHWGKKERKNSFIQKFKNGQWPESSFQDFGRNSKIDIHNKSFYLGNADNAMQDNQHVKVKKAIQNFKHVNIMPDLVRLFSMDPDFVNSILRELSNINKGQFIFNCFEIKKVYKAYDLSDFQGDIKLYLKNKKGLFFTMGCLLYRQNHNGLIFLNSCLYPDQIISIFTSKDEVFHGWSLLDLFFAKLTSQMQEALSFITQRLNCMLKSDELLLRSVSISLESKNQVSLLFLLKLVGSDRFKKLYSVNAEGFLGKGWCLLELFFWDLTLQTKKALSLLTPVLKAKLEDSMLLARCLAVALDQKNIVSLSFLVKLVGKEKIRSLFSWNSKCGLNLLKCLFRNISAGVRAVFRFLDEVIKDNLNHEILLFESFVFLFDGPNEFGLAYLLDLYGEEKITDLFINNNFGNVFLLEVFIKSTSANKSILGFLIPTIGGKLADDELLPYVLASLLKNKNVIGLAYLVKLVDQERIKGLFITNSDVVDGGSLLNALFICITNEAKELLAFLNPILQRKLEDEGVLLSAVGVLLKNKNVIGLAYLVKLVDQERIKRLFSRNPLWGAISLLEEFFISTNADGKEVLSFLDQRIEEKLKDEMLLWRCYVSSLAAQNEFSLSYLVNLVGEKKIENNFLSNNNDSFILGFFLKTTVEIKSTLIFLNPIIKYKLRNEQLCGYCFLMLLRNKNVIGLTYFFELVGIERIKEFVASDGICGDTSFLEEVFANITVETQLVLRFLNGVIKDKLTHEKLFAGILYSSLARQNFGLSYLKGLTGEERIKDFCIRNNLLDERFLINYFMVVTSETKKTLSFLSPLFKAKLKSDELLFKILVSLLKHKYIDGLTYLLELVGEKKLHALFFPSNDKVNLFLIQTLFAVCTDEIQLVLCFLRPSLKKQLARETFLRDCFLWSLSQKDKNGLICIFDLAGQAALIRLFESNGQVSGVSLLDAFFIDVTTEAKEVLDFLTPVIKNHLKYESLLLRCVGVSLKKKSVLGFFYLLEIVGQVRLESLFKRNEEVLGGSLLEVFFLEVSSDQKDALSFLDSVIQEKLQDDSILFRAIIRSLEKQNLVSLKYALDLLGEDPFIRLFENNTDFFGDILLEVFFLEVSFDQKDALRFLDSVIQEKLQDDAILLRIIGRSFEKQNLVSLKYALDLLGEAPFIRLAEINTDVFGASLLDLHLITVSRETTKILAFLYPLIESHVENTDKIVKCLRNIFMIKNTYGVKFLVELTSRELVSSVICTDIEVFKSLFAFADNDFFNFILELTNGNIIQCNEDSLLICLKELIKEKNFNLLPNIEALYGEKLIRRLIKEIQDES